MSGGGPEGSRSPPGPAPSGAARSGEAPTGWPPARREAALAARAGLRTIAVTGTNGKTTTTSMIGAIVAAAGEVPAVLTTVGSRVGAEDVPHPAPGSDSPGLHQLAVVERAVAAGARSLAVEMTSLALGRGLAARWRPHVAVFTNLTRDHLDVHPSPEAYLAAKAQLFLNLAPGGVAILNRDDPSSALLAEVLPAGCCTLWYALSETERIDLAPIDVWCGFGETRVTLAESPLAAALGGALTLRTTGRVHVANALAAALAASAAGYPAEAIRSGLAAFSPVAGRFELVTPDATRPRVVVDYAHTPDGLLGTLDTARALLAAEAASRAGPAGRVVLVFGCGGGRDRGKRPEMGAVADALADRVFLTSDNPRGEAPAAIAAEVLAGVPAPRASWRVEHDRAVAIAAAIAEAGPEDAVVIAGKGHEETQIFADGVRPFRDRAVALAALGLPARS